MTSLTATTLAAESSIPKNWTLGCFIRPWTLEKLHATFDQALDGIKAAGCNVMGLLTRTPGEPFAGSDATPEYLATLKERIARRGLKANMAAVRTKNDLALEAQIQDMRRQIDNAKTLGVEFLLTFGVDKPEQEANYLALMRDAAPYAAERNLKLVLKPHGGSSGAAAEIQRTISAVKHSNFKIWFDAGNIIYYTGKDPLEQLKPIAAQVTGFCAKDCDKQNGEVWLPFGKGKVDFPAVFAELQRAGFNGPVMIECCAPGDNSEAMVQGVSANRELLERTFLGL